MLDKVGTEVSDRARMGARRGIKFPTGVDGEMIAVEEEDTVDAVGVCASADGVMERSTCSGEV